jgi:dienelactone hydrolase
MKKWVVALCVLVTMMTECLAQELVRRSFLGVQMENINDDVARIMGLESRNGVLINNVIPASTAAEAGFKKGDVLLRINDKTFSSTQEAVDYVGAQKSNTTFSYELIRNKQKIKGTSSFKPYPFESYNDLDVVYTQTKTVTGIQRVIITQPKNKTNLPVIVFIGGIGCYSLDSPLDTSRSELQLLNKLAREGFTAVRIEKPGIGDGAGHGKACNEIGFHEEVQGYVQAIEDLKKRKGLTTKDVFIIGHSMGGVMAPLVASKTSIKGIIAYGTIGSNFMEYLLKTRRTIGEAYGWAPDETDAYIKDVCECSAYYFINKMSTEEAARKKADCTDYLSVFDLRARKYNEELYELNIPAAWKDYNGTALLAWGKTDFVASREDHEIIVQTLKHYHKDAAIAYIENADHGMNTASSFQQARTNPGSYNREVGAVFLGWLKKQS